MKKLEPELLQALCTAIGLRQKKALAVAVAKVAEIKSTSTNDDLVSAYYQAIKIYREILMAEQSQYPDLYKKKRWQGQMRFCDMCNMYSRGSACQSGNCGHPPPTKEEWKQKIHSRDWDRMSVGAIEHHVEECARKTGWSPDKHDQLMRKNFRDAEMYAMSGSHTLC
eukprot:TRINITY_DN72066_c0_g1_i1.p1 TRINITY_DN72066_c0_g1~~TRINITY_DN72066_c0_g1_i1.p1  ORF type:complete len:174 (-),score=31.87 TRINITY_DN72066_c0_g1_i1:27-527(-)